ncbi:MAG TPA: sialidase family protein, partial [Mycobacteriales bacterium]|nr:sialidase family protein [Mycobacteriales bacterium]
KGKGPNSANVYLSYHDFGESMIWVNASHDGGKTWSLPVPAITTPSALATSACNTVPGGTAIDQRNGWIYAAWTAGSNAADNVATGCNYTQGAVFNNLFVAVSKDGGKTFTDTLAVSTPGVTDVNAPSDLSEIFSSISVDREGGVYVAYPAFVNGEYGAYLAYSPPADASGTLHFGRPLKVDPPAVHTAYFVRTIAGDRGRADVIFLGSPVRNIPATAANDAAFTGANPNQPNCVPEVTGGGAYGVRFPGKPCEMPAKSPWYLYLAQTLNLTSGHPTVTDTKLRPDAVHTGDICTLGIFCLPSDDRDLADVYDVKIDNTGGAQIAYTAETPNRAHNEIDFQCQSGGPGLYAGVKVRDCQAPAGRAAAVVPGAPGALPVAFGTGRGSPVAEGLGLAAALVLLVGAGLASLRRLRPVGIATA